MRPVSIPNTFQTKTGQIPLSQLDSNFTTLATAINDVNTGNAYYVDSSGTPNQIVVTTPSNVTATYQAGLAIAVQIGNTNTATAVTININGQGATNLANVSGTTGVAIGQLTALDIVNLVFDGTSFIVTAGSGLATSTMSMTLAGNFSIPVPTSGTSLTVNGVSGTPLVIVSNGVSTITNTTPNGYNAYYKNVVTSYASMAIGVNATNAIDIYGIGPFSFGIGSTSAGPFNIGINGATRLSMSTTASVQSSYNFNGALGSGSATSGGASALPATPQGYWAFQLNGSNVKVPYYNN